MKTERPELAYWVGPSDEDEGARRRREDERVNGLGAADSVAVLSAVVLAVFIVFTIVGLLMRWR